MSINIISFFCSVFMGLVTVLTAKVFIDSEYSLIVYITGGLVAGFTFALVRKKLLIMNVQKKS